MSITTTNATYTQNEQSNQVQSNQVQSNQAQSNQTQSNQTLQKHIHILCSDFEIPQYQKLIETIAPKLYIVGIQIIRTTILPYRFRLFLSGPKGEGQIDFIHKKSMQWTACQVVSQTKTAREAVEICS